MRRRLSHLAFQVGIVLKGLDGLVELIGGILLWVVSPESIWIAAIRFTYMLSDDPHDFVSNHILHIAWSTTGGTKSFAAIYLLSHGVLKVVLVAALLRSQRWAYPSAIAVFIAFLVYQVYRYAVGHSIWMLVLSVLDVAVIVLTWNEYRMVRARRT